RDRRAPRICRRVLASLRRCPEGADMSDIAEAIRQALAASFISHIYQGDCPDELQPDARDSECGACRLLMALQAAQAAQAEPVAWMDNEGRVLSLEQMKNAR